MTPDNNLAWVTTTRYERLHLLTDGTWETWDEDQPGQAVACGRILHRAVMPGVISRLGLERCTQCCTAAGIPPGYGTWANAQGGIRG